MAVVQPLLAYASERARLSRVQFLQEVTFPCLFFRRVEALHDTDRFDTLASQPVTDTDKSMEGIAEVRPDPSANAFGFIAVGRAGNNDIVIPDGMISKFHAYFLERERVWTLSDAGSSNGTFVNGERLEKERPRQLQFEDRIDFGDSVSAAFLSPEQTYELVRSTWAYLRRERGQSG